VGRARALSTRYLRPPNISEFIALLLRMVPSDHPILLIGATSGTGKHLAEMLLAAGARVRVLARNKEKAQRCFGDRVELVIGDVTHPDGAFRNAFHGVHDVVFTVGAPPRPARGSVIKTVDHDGLVAAVNAAKEARITGRFLYMNTMGNSHGTLFMRMLNVMKPGLSRWRMAADAAVIGSGLPYVIVRAAILTNGQEGEPPCIFTDDAPLRPWMHVPRKTVARVFEAILKDPVFSEREIAVVGAKRQAMIEEQLAALQASSSKAQVPSFKVSG
jgi:uncharacterized protein YbjT (DUF2867 family)